MAHLSTLTNRAAQSFIHSAAVLFIYCRLCETCDHRKPDYRKPQDEIYHPSSALMSSDNWLWISTLSIQTVTGAVFVKKTPSRSTAVEHPTCGALMNSVFISHVSLNGKVSYLDSNFPVLQNKGSEAVKFVKIPDLVFMFLYLQLLSDINWETVSIRIFWFVFPLLKRHANYCLTCVQPPRHKINTL